MSAQGWVFFSIFWGLVIGLNLFCYSKILKNRHKHGRE